MKTIYFFLLLSSSLVFSQEDAWLYFKDKPDAANFISTPLKMLSQRALDRRNRQNIVLDNKDVPLSNLYYNAIKTSSGISVLAKSKWLNALHIRGTVTAINGLKTLAFVDKIVFANRNLNTTGKPSTSLKPKKIQKSVAETTDYLYGSSANQIQMLNGHLVHQKNYTAADKIIAVLDAGFPGVDTALPFQRLRSGNKILGGYDFVHRSASFYTGDNHGTLVLSTMGGYKENTLVGTAPDASYYLFITEDVDSETPLEESLWVEAAEKADSLGVDVINTSLGYFGFDNPNYSHSYSDMTGNSNFISKGANCAFSRGMIVVASAGNEGNTSEPHLGAPAEATEVIAVGAVTASKIKTGFSSIGPSFDGRVKPNVMAQGQNAVVSNEMGTITTANGTSFAGPILAGMIASFWQAFPNKTNQEIRAMVYASADRFSSPNAQYGYGIPDFNLALTQNEIVQNDLVFYPNPSLDEIHFKLPTKYKNGVLKIYTNLGQKVLEQLISSADAVISVSNLSNGIYFYTFDSEEFSNSGKIIKN